MNLHNLMPHFKTKKIIPLNFIVFIRNLQMKLYNLFLSVKISSKALSIKRKIMIISSEIEIQNLKKLALLLLIL